MANEQLETIEIDRTKVRERIDRFIQNDGKTNTYVKAPSLEVVGRFLQYKDIASEWQKVSLPYLCGGSPGAMLPSVAEIHTNLMYAEINRVFFRAYSQLLKVSCETSILPLARYWGAARYWEDNPLKGIRKLFFWDFGLQKYFDKHFLKGRQKAYKWLQEERPLEQCDIKNWLAILGFDLINKYNQKPETSRKAPLNEFVEEQISRIPEEIIKRSMEEKTFNTKWVNGERAFDVHASIGEIYEEQLQQLA